MRSHPTIPSNTLSMKWTTSLSELRSVDATRCGGKAANLGELLAAGFEVPAGFVVHTDAFDQAVTDSDLSEIPTDIATEIRRQVAALGDIALAVRSSGVAEDTDDASFAGQYDTFLDVRGPEAVLEAVKKCWASTRSDHVVAYQNKHGLRGSMAVVVQVLVDADIAGVAFTANPITGARDEVVVSAVHGLGEALVSGEVSPDEWVVGPNGAECRTAPQDAIDEAGAREIALLAARVRDHYGRPQDIEWARKDGVLHLLQARPITALPDAPIPIDFKVPEGFWERESSHFPTALTPMGETFWMAPFNDVTEALFKEAGMMMERVDHRAIGGLVYTRMVPPGGKDMTPPPNWLIPWIMPVLRRVIPSMRKTLARAVEAVEEDWFFHNVNRWHTQWRRECQEKIARDQALDLTALTDGELADHLVRLRADAAWYADVHFRYGLSASLISAEFAFFCRDELGWDEAKMLGLLSGASNMTTAPARALAPLLVQIRRSERLTELIKGRAHISLITREFPTFGSDFDAYQGEYGSRALSLELSDPTISELPHLTIGLLAGMLERNFDAHAVDQEVLDVRAETLATAHGLLDSEQRARFDYLYERALLAYATRDDGEFYTVSVPLAQRRYGVLEVGRRGVASGALQCVEDAFFLELDEVVRVCAGGDLSEVIATRRGHRAWALQRLDDAPGHYGTPPGDPPSMSWMPDKARQTLDGFMWIREQAFAMDQSNRTQDGVGGIEGIAASAGTYTGTVRIVLNETQFDRVQPGDVLVCPTTSPVWSVVFPNIGALVTDKGGLLSHPSVIAREYRIPAVVATGNATELLRDGQQVRVDGTTGRIEVLS